MNMYAENIMDHYKNPRNRGSVENADVDYRDTNPSCGDIIEIKAAISDGIIEEIRFTGEGCAISQASASLLTEAVKGKTLEEFENMKKEDVLDMLGVDISPMRLKCALLAFTALRKGMLLYKSNEKVKK